MIHSRLLGSRQAGVFMRTGNAGGAILIKESKYGENPIAS